MKRFLSYGLWLHLITQNTQEPRVGCGDRRRGLSGHPPGTARLSGIGVGSGSCKGARLGGYFCTGAAQEAPPGEESIHPAAETSSATIFLVKHKAGGREREAD